MSLHRGYLDALPSPYCGRLDDHEPHTWSTPYSRERHRPFYLCPGPPVVAGCDRPREDTP